MYNKIIYTYMCIVRSFNCDFNFLFVFFLLTISICIQQNLHKSSQFVGFCMVHSFGGPVFCLSLSNNNS